MDVVWMGLLNGLSWGLLLFLVSAGLTLTYSLLGIVNFAHGAFYMLGAYLAVVLVPLGGWAVGLCGAALGTGLVGVLFQRLVLQRLQDQGHLAEMLATFGLSLMLTEGVQWLWGRGPQVLDAPPALQGAWLLDGGAALPRLRLAIMGVAGLVALVLWWLHARTRVGLLMRAVRTQPLVAQMLGHDVPLLRWTVFGAGCALAGLAGVWGGAAFVVQPDMAAQMSLLAFVVVVIGGMGSLVGAWWAALGVGLIQGGLASWPGPIGTGWDWARWAPLSPYAMLALVLLWRRDRSGVPGAAHG